MAVFSLMAIGGTGLGPVVSGWIELRTSVGYKWIAWVPFMCGVLPLYLIHSHLFNPNPTLHREKKTAS